MAQSSVSAPIMFPSILVHMVKCRNILKVIALEMNFKKSQLLTLAMIGLFKNERLEGKSLTGSKSLAVEICTDLCAMLAKFGSRVTKFGKESCLHPEISLLIDTPQPLLDLLAEIRLSVCRHSSHILSFRSFSTCMVCWICSL